MTDPHLLRAEALVLLETAAAIDGLRPFILSHRHDTGTTSYLIWSRNMPDEALAASVLESEFDPESEELAIEATDLKELVGVAPAAVVPYDEVEA